MSEVTTSPAPVAAESAAPAAEAAPAVAESPNPPGSQVESNLNQAQEDVPVEATEVSETETAEVSGGFDSESWDGNIDSLPSDLQDPVRYLHRQLEGGYTKKFQDLSDQRKEFETNQTTWTESKGAFEANLKQAMEEKELYQQLLEGAEDPRIADLAKKSHGFETELAQLREEYDSYKQLVDADIQAQADEYAEKFRKKHSEIFDDDGKREQLGQLLDEGWSPETGIQLVGKDEKLIELANSLREQGTPMNVAIEHAVMKLGVGPRNPRPGAKITAGAKSRNNPASVRDTAFNGNPRQDRHIAARAALEWNQRQKNR